MRNDGFLYSGIPASAPKREAKTRKTIAEDRRDARIVLTPAGDIVMEVLQREIDLLSTIDYLNIEQMMSDEHFKAEMMARKKTVERLKVVKTTLSNLLKEPTDGPKA